MRRVMLGLILALLAGAATPLKLPAAWSQPTKPFHIVGPIYYVGTQGIASYLIRSQDGLILLDGGLEESAPLIETSITELGFRLSDIKLMIATHAHFDHVAGLAQLKRDTGAVLAASAGDRVALETGIPPSELSYGVYRFPPVKVDRKLTDRDPIRLGEISITPIITPGHTPGCTTWTMRVVEAARSLDVLFPCSMAVAGNKLVRNEGYPGIIQDFRESFITMRTLSADVVLTAHPDQADVLGRAQRRDEGDSDAFLASDLLSRLVDEAEAAFDKELLEAEAVELQGEGL
ncbi:MAG: subclass B3 metallo-beta-lactamase [Novosphingobium sp.]|nr:subclass B3 metallo-beta-lactamase [Novosphingobium sp.]